MPPGKLPESREVIQHAPKPPRRGAGLRPLRFARDDTICPVPAAQGAPSNTRHDRHVRGQAPINTWGGSWVDSQGHLIRASLPSFNSHGLVSSLLARVVGSEGRPVLTAYASLLREAKDLLRSSLVRRVTHTGGHTPRGPGASWCMYIVSAQGAPHASRPAKSALDTPAEGPSHTRRRF